MQSLATLPKDVQDELSRILTAGPDACTEADRAFLLARRSYLNPEQKAVFEISDAPVVEKPAQKQESAESEAAGQEPTTKTGSRRKPSQKQESA